MKYMHGVLAAMAVCFFTASAAAPAFAHHSVAMYDLTKRRTISGTVVKFDWQNPHCWLWVAVLKSDDTTQQIGIEMSSPGANRRAGLRWDDIKVGQKVTVIIFPLRDGRDGGLLGKVTWEDGHSWQPSGMASPLPPGSEPL